MALSTFSWEPSYTFVETIGRNVDNIEYESGKETRLLHGIVQHSFDLHFDHITTTVKDEIVAFFELHSGRLVSFYFTNPNDSVVYEVYFSDDTLSMTSDVYGYWTIDIKLAEKMG